MEISQFFTPNSNTVAGFLFEAGQEIKGNGEINLRSRGKTVEPSALAKILMGAARRT